MQKKVTQDEKQEPTRLSNVRKWILIAVGIVVTTDLSILLPGFGEKPFWPN